MIPRKVTIAGHVNPASCVRLAWLAWRILGEPTLSLALLLKTLEASACPECFDINSFRSCWKSASPPTAVSWGTRDRSSGNFEVIGLLLPQHGQWTQLDQLHRECSQAYHNYSLGNFRGKSGQHDYPARAA